MVIDYNLIDNVELEIDYKSGHDFTDSYIISADYDGQPMSEDMLDDLNNDSQYVYDLVISEVY